MTVNKSLFQNVVPRFLLLPAPGILFFTSLRRNQILYATLATLAGHKKDKGDPVSVLRLSH